MPNRTSKEQHEQLRDELVPLLRTLIEENRAMRKEIDEMKSDAKEEDNPEIVDLMESLKFEIKVISQHARKAFEEELLPQIAPMVTTSTQAEVVQTHVRDLLDQAIKQKNSLYLLLIRYKSNDASDEQFFNDIKAALDQWVLAYTKVD